MERIDVGSGGGVVVVVITTVGDRWWLPADEERWWRAAIVVVSGRVVVIFVIIVIIFFANRWPLQLYDDIHLFQQDAEKDEGQTAFSPALTNNRRTRGASR